VEDELWNVFESGQKQRGGVLAADGDETLLQVEEYIEAEEDLNVSQRTKKSDAKSKVIKIITELIGEHARTNLDETPFWQLDALCAQRDPELFFPEKGGCTRAKRICGDCKVKAQCLTLLLLINGSAFGAELRNASVAVCAEN
jgi:hypothetical protein